MKSIMNRQGIQGVIDIKIEEILGDKEEKNILRVAMFKAHEQARKGLPLSTYTEAAEFASKFE